MNDEAVYRTAPATPGLLKIGSDKLFMYIIIQCVQIARPDWTGFLKKNIWHRFPGQIGPDYKAK